MDKCEDGINTPCGCIRSQDVFPKSTLKKKVFHGTPTGDFIDFNPQFRGRRTKHKKDAVAYHFTDTRRDAESYSLEYLKPLGLRAKEYLGYIPETLIPPKDARTIEAFLDIRKPLLLEKSKSITPKLLRNLPSMGYDGIIAGLGGGSMEYVVFDPNQIVTDKRIIMECSEYSI
jgi:hypothetical protein